MITILLVDDHKVLRDGLRALLESEPDLTVVAEAGNGRDAVHMARDLQPDIIVMDLGLPDISGLETIRLIRAENVKSRIVVLSMYIRREFVMPAIEAGCDGYVPKSSTHTSLLEAIRVVLTGERYLHPKAATALVESVTAKETETELFQQLSEREQDVLRLTALGYTSREIGERLIISSKTVETYRQRAMEKLHLEHRSDLVKFALRAGILDDFDD
ncbi:MAG: response regulator transcription factor [Ardenticatenaceae bacterium]|nr:response regulator transcription factor [Ardenticatenaceae bacterium]MCB9444505.1 response regulator transcription factor [Ardenticatenaceae bacterium]